MVLAMMIGRLIVEDVGHDNCYIGTTHDHEFRYMGSHKVGRISGFLHERWSWIMIFHVT
jgi:predicted GIY-YIG superfamily endonuclease